MENINILLRKLRDVYKIKLSINQCKAYANKLDDDCQKRIIIFSTATDESGQESSPLEGKNVH